MRNKLIGSGLALIGGSALGAVAMYLLDPEEGEHRRQQIASGASGAFKAVASHASHGLNDLADHVHDLSDKLTHHASKLADQASDLSDTARDSASQATHELAGHARRISAAIADKARQYASTAQDYANQGASAVDWSGHAKRAQRYARSAIGNVPAESHGLGVAGYSLSAGSLLALGLGAMWLFDSEHGEDRREMIGEHLNQYLGHAGESFRTTGGYLTRQLTAAYDEARQYLGHSPQKSSGDDLSENPGGAYGAPEGGPSEEGSLPSFDQSHLVRLGVGIAGGALGFYGATRRDWVGLGLGLSGLGMAACGLSALDYQSLTHKAWEYSAALSDRASGLSDQAREWTGTARDQAGEWTSQAADLARRGIDAVRGHNETPEPQTEATGKKAEGEERYETNKAPAKKSK